MVLLKHIQFFGPSPMKRTEIVEHDVRTCFIVTSVMKELKLFTLFENVSEREV